MNFKLVGLSNAAVAHGGGAVPVRIVPSSVSPVFREYWGTVEAGVSLKLLMKQLVQPASVPAGDAAVRELQVLRLEANAGNQRWWRDVNGNASEYTVELGGASGLAVRARGEQVGSLPVNAQGLQGAYGALDGLLAAERPERKVTPRPAVKGATGQFRAEPQAPLVYGHFDGVKDEVSFSVDGLNVALEPGSPRHARLSQWLKGSGWSAG